MPDPSEPDPTPPLPPAPDGAAQHLDGKRIGLLALSMLLLMLGASLAYASLTLRWAYYSGGPLTASDLSPYSPAQRAAMFTIGWGGPLSGCWCGPLPIIWPALALLSSLPLLVAAMRRHAVTRWWTRFGLLCAALGFANVLVIAEGIALAGGLGDTGLEYRVDGGTLAIALSGYVLLALGILVLTVLTHATPFAPASRRPTPTADA